MKFDWVERTVFAFIGLVLVALVGFMVIAIPAALEGHKRRVAACEAQGGTVKSVSKTTTGTGIDSKGKPVFTSNTETTYYCLRDGAVLDIW